MCRETRRAFTDIRSEHQKGFKFSVFGDLNMKMGEKTKEVLFEILIIILLVAALFSITGCGYQNTDGVTRKLLPFEVGFGLKTALASGETEQRIGLGKNAVTEVANADTGFNEARARVGIAEAQNKMNSVYFSGPQQSAANLNFTNQEVNKALENKKK